MRHSSLRPSLLASLGVALMAGAVPLAAQRTRATVRGGASATSATSATEQQMRALERRVDSLVRIYSNADELSVDERRRVGDMLDRTVEQIDVLSMRLARLQAEGVAGRGEIRVRLAPMGEDEAGAYMLRALTASRGVHPRGWVGIEVVGPAREPRIERGEQIIHYLGYPAIISVEPSSPAELAGIVPGDTLIAYDGHDVSDADIAITRLLKPNKRVAVRIRREGRTFDVPVTVADVPSRIVLRRELNAPEPPRVATALSPSVRFPRPTDAPAPPAASLVMGLPAPMAAPSRPARAPATAFAPAPAPMPAAVYLLGIDAIAGAQLVPITPGLGRTLGVRYGVLVTNAPVGSPAYESGLRDGDVITRAAGQALRTVDDLRERVAAAANDGEHSLALDLVRGKRTRKGSLRW